MPANTGTAPVKEFPLSGETYGWDDYQKPTDGKKQHSGTTIVWSDTPGAYDVPAKNEKGQLIESFNYHGAFVSVVKGNEGSRVECTWEVTAALKVELNQVKKPEATTKDTKLQNVAPASCKQP